MRGTWACCLLVMTALAGCGDHQAVVTDDRPTGTVTTGTSSPSVGSDDGVAITYRNRADTFVYARRGDNTSVVTASETTIDLAGKDRIACKRQDDNWQCISFGEDPMMNLMHPGARTFENLLALLPPAAELAEARTVTSRAARCGEIQPSSDLLRAITFFGGTDVNRGAENIPLTSLCLDEESGLLLSLRTPVPGKGSPVEITTTEARPATEEDFTPPAEVNKAPTSTPTTSN